MKNNACFYFIVCLLFSLIQLPASASSLKIITYNIWNGFDWGKDENRHTRFLNWMKTQDPDVLALQELCGYTEEKLQEDAKIWGHPYAILLKTKGYPVGLTSKKPIELKERMLQDLWHGMLHVKTYDIDFFVVHLSPADCEFRMREASLISERIRAISKAKFVILGDFNAMSPMDADLNLEKSKLLERYRAGDAKNEKYNNLRDGEFDYSVMATFLALPAIDPAHARVKGKERYSFPAPVLVGKYYDDDDHIKRSRQRIDYILLSPNLAQKCEDVRIFHDEVVGGLSDHYPVMATIKE